MALVKTAAVYCNKKTDSDSDARTDSGRLFWTDAAAAGKARSPMVGRRVRGATMADVRL